MSIRILIPGDLPGIPLETERPAKPLPETGNYTAKQRTGKTKTYQKPLKGR